jgi:hypothetical protein
MKFYKESINNYLRGLNGLKNKENRLTRRNCCRGYQVMIIKDLVIRLSLLELIRLSKLKMKVKNCIKLKYFN